jgi:hypothetical protein
MIVLAVFLAPLVEEVLFRVLLQGWLEAVLTQRAAQHEEVVAAATTLPPTPESFDGEIPPEILPPAETEPANGAEPPPTLTTFRVAPEPVEPLVLRSAGWMPIFFSSGLFALSHIEYGPSAAPLFFFALVLGYLYRQTHRIWPSLVLHMALNATTMLMLVASLLNK